MAKATNTATVENDFTKFFDFTKFDADFTKFAYPFGKDFALPHVDSDQLMSAQKKNLEAMTAANRVAVEGFQALARRQAELVRQATEDFGKAARELSGSKSLEDTLVKQTDLVKEAYEQALSNVRELTEMTVKSQSEAAQLLNARLAESLDEFKAVVKKSAK